MPSDARLTAELLIAASRGVTVRSGEQLNESSQFSLRERSLDQREELALLAPHVLMKLLSEAVEHTNARAVTREVISESANADVIDQDARDDRPIEVAKAGVAGEQDLLLLAEVALSISSPVVKKGVACSRGRFLGGALQALRQHQSVVMVARERSESVMALHGQP